VGRRVYLRAFGAEPFAWTVATAETTSIRRLAVIAASTVLDSCPVVHRQSHVDALAVIQRDTLLLNNAAHLQVCPGDYGTGKKRGDGACLQKQLTLQRNCVREGNRTTDNGTAERERRGKRKC